MSPQAETGIPTSYQELSYRTIRCRHHPEDSVQVTPVVVLALHRPEAHNAFNSEMREELVSAFKQFDADDRVRCVVVTGNGRLFCAGADLTPGKGAFQRGQKRTGEHRDGGGQVALAIFNCRKPVIAAIQGAAVGVGITMTLPMSIRIAYSQAKIGFVFARRGIIMEACSSFFLPKLIGVGRAMHLITTGATYKASDPLFNGLFSETLDKPEKVLPRALQIAEEVAANTSLVSTELMKQMMWRGVDSPEAAHLLESKVIYSLYESKDAAEGVRAFLQKRDVNFSGRLVDLKPEDYPWWTPLDVNYVPPNSPAGKPSPKL